MHIAHRTEDLLIVEHRPTTLAWAITLLAVAGPLTAFRWLGVEGLGPTLLAVFTLDFPLLVLFLVSVRRLQIVLDRRAGTLRLHERSVAQDRRLSIPLDCLVRAERETSLRRLPFLPPRGHFHRAVLVVAAGRELRRYPVTSVFLIGPAQARRAATAVNDWLCRSVDRRAATA
jgi:hypothetical protein